MGGQQVIRTAASTRRTLLAELHAVNCLLRPPFALLLALVLAIGLSQSATLPGLSTRALIVLALTGWMLASVALNDLADAAIDRVNLIGDTRRQLAQGTIDAVHLKGLALVAGVLSLGAAVALGWMATVVVTAGLALSAAYSLPPLRLSSRGALTSAALPLGYVAVPFLLGLSTDPRAVTGRTWLLLAGLYTGFVGRLALKDFRDQRGDTLYGKRTFLVRHGRRATTRFSATLVVLGGAVTAAALPEASPPTWVSVGAQLGLVVVFLRRLSRDDEGMDDRANVLAIAILGRSLLVVVLLQCWGAGHGWSSAVTAASVLLATGIGLTTVVSKWRASSSFDLGAPAVLADLAPPLVRRPRQSDHPGGAGAVEMRAGEQRRGS